MKVEDLFAYFERLGEAAIKAQLMQANASGAPIEHAAAAQQWLLEKENERRKNEEAENQKRYDQMLEASLASAAASQRSARWTFWAAIAALFAAAASWVQILSARPPT